MAQKASVHGFTVTFEDNAKDGISYLEHDLDLNEAKVFFDQARVRGSAQFEDDEDRQYTLFYQNGAFVLARR